MAQILMKNERVLSSIPIQSICLQYILQAYSQELDLFSPHLSSNTKLFLSDVNL